MESSPTTSFRIAYSFFIFLTCLYIKSLFFFFFFSNVYMRPQLCCLTTLLSPAYIAVPLHLILIPSFRLPCIPVDIGMCSIVLFQHLAFPLVQFSGAGESFIPIDANGYAPASVTYSWYCKQVQSVLYRNASHSNLQNENWIRYRVSWNYWSLKHSHTTEY